MNKLKIAMAASAALLSLGLGSGAQAQQAKPQEAPKKAKAAEAPKKAKAQASTKATSQEPGMTFFITSAGSGKGADLGGLKGADAHCQSLAAAAGAGKHTWRAYLSTTASGGTPAVNARDRIGKGPWHNAQGRLIARDVAELHGINNINRMVAVNEKGGVIHGRADTPNQHDILTGSQPDGTAIAGDASKTTCGNWTMSGAGAAMVGHHDRHGLKEDAPSVSWNSSHPSRGCSQENLRASGGAGMFYCFAAK